VTYRVLLNRLLNTTLPAEVRKILRENGDYSEIEVGEAFGEGTLEWRYYGENESNLSVINVGTDPAKALVERVTNAFDAVLRKEAIRRSRTGSDAPDSPEAAAADWFGRPITSHESGLYQWDNYRQEDIDRKVKVILQDGDEEAQPTVDVVDDGVGLSAKEFPDTILSLHAGNKIQEPYLIGAFGQGGSATFSFADYTLIVSRRFNNKSQIAFTVVRRLNLGEEFAHDAYAYLATPSGSVPEIKVEDDLRVADVEDEDIRNDIRTLETGTLVRHFGYKLGEDYDKSLQATGSNLYHFFHSSLFDPLFPFRLIDIRSRYSTNKDEVVKGSRNRLMGHADSADGTTDETKPGTQVLRYAPEEYVDINGDDQRDVRIEYWAVFNWRRKGDDIVIRKNSSQLFVSKRHPIIGTLHGQTHGEMTRRTIREAGLGMLTKYLVVHVNATGASKDVRTALFSSTREGFKEGKPLQRVKEVIRSRLEDDHKLKELERRLVQDLANAGQEAGEEVRKAISELLQDAGYNVTEQGDTSKENDSKDKQDQKPTRGGGQRKQDPIKTLEYPNVSFFEIAYPDGDLELPANSVRTVRIETDAAERFDQEERLAVKIDDGVDLISETRLSDGHKKWRFTDASDSEPGEVGTLVFRITKPNGDQLSVSIDYIINEPVGTSREAKGEIPKFEVLAIDPDDAPEDFSQVWGEPTKQTVEEVAYKVTESPSEGLIVHYSTGFEPYRRARNSLKDKVSRAEFFKQQYEIWIGYHAILQWQERKELLDESEASEEVLNTIEKKERALVATMQAKQAIQSSDYLRKLKT